MRPTNQELVSKIASTIDAFITMEGIEEFKSDRLKLTVNDEYRVSISASPLSVGNVLISMPLNELGLDSPPISDQVEAGGMGRHMAVDLAAHGVILWLDTASDNE